MAFSFNPFTRKYDQTGATKTEKTILDTLDERVTAIEPTEESVTYYVDPSTGSDSNEGSISSPFKTLVAPKLLSIYTGKIKHRIRVAVLGDITNSDDAPRVIAPEFYENGSLAIYGVGAAVKKEIHGGPHTVTGISAIDTVGENGQIITIGAGGLTAHEFKGYWLRIVTGGHIAKTFMIADNTSNTITAYVINLSSSDCVENGDTIEIIRPPITIAIEDLDIQYRAVTASANTMSIARLVFHNIILDGSASSNTYQQFCINSTTDFLEGPCFDFVLFNIQPYGFVVGTVVINAYTPVDYVVSDGQSGNLESLWDCPGFIVTSDGLQNDTTIFVMGDFRSLYTTTTGQIQLDLRTSIFYCGVVAAVGTSHLEVGTINGILTGVSTSIPAIHLHGGDWTVNINSIGSCSYAVETGLHVRVDIEQNSTCSPTATAHGALKIGAMCNITIWGSGSYFLGATSGEKAYSCTYNTSIKSDTWPASSTLVTDSKGSNLMRLA